MEHQIAGKRLVTFLGTGPKGGYSEVEYRWRDGKGRDQQHRTHYVARALAEWSRQSITEVVVLGTAESFEKNGDSLDAALAETDLSEAQRVPVPAGASNDQLWETFNVTKEALRVAKGQTLLVDITHGFRAQPFFAAAVLFFLRAVDPEIVPVEVVYGAPTDDASIFEIWDLTAFVDLVDWALGLQMFLKTGRADEIAKTTQDLGRSLQRSWSDDDRQGVRPNLGTLGKALEAFSSDLQTVRTGSLLLGTGKNRTKDKASARRLFDAVEEASEEQALAKCPPLADVLSQVHGMVQALQTSSLQGPTGHQALVALAKLYERLGRYAEAGTTLREAWITRYAEETASKPGYPEYDRKRREVAERHWREAPDSAARDIAEVRNDLAHGGFGKRPLPPRTIKEKLSTLINSLESDGANVTPPAPIRSQDSVFVNISNHPIAEWSPRQSEAALALAPTLVDLGFPTIAPTASSEEVMKLAEDTAGKIPPSTTHAMVMGEHTLIVALVRELAGRGIKVYAATTERNVTVLDNGSKESRFHFVRFRQYLTSEEP